MPRLVIVEPAYASTVGHHGEVNRPLLAALQRAGWQAELWADVALEAEATAPQPLRGVFSGCGYEDPRHWRDLGGMVQLARRLEQQLELANHGLNVDAWVAHSLLPFQLLGLARWLARAPAAAVLISLMFAPGETLEGEAGDPQAIANCRVALAALAKATAQQGHLLTLAMPSRQHLDLYAPLLEGMGLPPAVLHPPVVGAGCTPLAVDPDQVPLVLLHWGDRKAGKPHREGLQVLRTLLEEGVPEALSGWGWLWHQHSREPWPAAEAALLAQAKEAGVNLLLLDGEVVSEAMQQWLARCALALLAYDPQRYRHRSSGLLWQWAACRAALDLPAAAAGYGSGWLAAEAVELGIGWCTPLSADGRGWLAALVSAVQLPAQPMASQLVEGFGGWVASKLPTPASAQGAQADAGLTVHGRI